MANRTIPKDKAGFGAYQRTYVGALAAVGGAYGVSPAQTTALQATQSQYEASVTAEEAALAAYHAAVKDRETKQAAHEANIRKTTHIINGTTTVTNTMRVAAGLPPHVVVRSTVGAPTSVPILRLEAGSDHAVICHYADANTPKRSAKPHGVVLCEIWVHTGDPQPADPSGYTFLRPISRTPYTDLRPAADAGKTFYAVARWVNAKGQVGPWSAPVTIHIPA